MGTGDEQIRADLITRKKSSKRVQKDMLLSSVCMTALKSEVTEWHWAINSHTVKRIKAKNCAGATDILGRQVFHCLWGWLQVEALQVMFTELSLWVSHERV